MTGQKQRIIRRFEREAKIKAKNHDMSFSLADIKRIIMLEGYACGHKGKPIFLDDNALSITAFYDWCESTGWQGDRSQCWECYCEESKNKLISQKKE